MRVLADMWSFSVHWATKSDMNASSNPYNVTDVAEATPRWTRGFLKQVVVVFACVVIGLMVMPHSGGSSSSSTGGVQTRYVYRNYGLPKWLTRDQTNGVSGWHIHAWNLIALFAIALTIAFGVVFFTGLAQRIVAKEQELAERE